MAKAYCAYCKQLKVIRPVLAEEGVLKTEQVAFSFVEHPCSRTSSRLTAQEAEYLFFSQDHTEMQISFFKQQCSRLRERTTVTPLPVTAAAA